jgi:hypothetical protein
MPLLNAFHLEWNLLNGMTLGQRQTNFNNRQIVIGKLASTNIRYEKVIWDLLYLINLIPLTNQCHYP